MDAEPYIGEIRIFAGNYAPQGWALCQGQLLPFKGNEILFSLLGTFYGGTALVNFNLPDLRSRVPIHQTPAYPLGKAGGVETTTLTTAQLPPHTHALQAVNTEGTVNTPVNNVFAGTGAGDLEYTDGAATVTLGAGSVTAFGANQGFSIVQPSTGISYIIALSGLYPDRA